VAAQVRDEQPTGDLPEAAPPHDGGHAERSATRHDLWTAMGRLPRRQRAVIVLRHFEDLTGPPPGVGNGTVTYRAHVLDESLVKGVLGRPGSPTCGSVCGSPRRTGLGAHHPRLVRWGASGLAEGPSRTVLRVAPDGTGPGRVVEENQSSAGGDAFGTAYVVQPGQTPRVTVEVPRGGTGRTLLGLVVTDLVS
jgi:hypothetical protein